MSCGEDNSVRLWHVADLASPFPVGGPLTGHSEAAVAVAFSPDGQNIATASLDKTVRLWAVR